ncbi:hypothetical protein IQ266_06015 [filamentous cyanobacterium LEGE 11480]|uniref:Uncharacterized protein n=1 Tax=Romeriopsis navalis LEGE 11480 TaxID=2777977 RepID=A0A928VMV5_9CYAN|nr:hypothetical protein [Romeriopsis navalis]MBE9029317.1 hypothetical protein [Romeriopsis navalis LEGE 11480]
MNQNMRFSALVLAVWLSVNLTGCVAAPVTYHYDLDSTSATTDCIPLGKLDGKLDVHVIRGKQCHRFRITDHVPNDQYLEVSQAADRSSLLSVTIAQPRLGGSYDAGDRVGSMQPGRCSSNKIHRLTDHPEPERDYSVAIVAISSLLCAGVLIFFFITQGINTFQSLPKRKRTRRFLQERMSQLFAKERWADELVPMLLVMLLLLLLGTIGIQQALFSIRYWQMSSVDACRLLVRSWF